MKQNFNKKINKKHQGFTLVESLIAIAILMISVATPMSIAYSGLLAAYLAEDQIVAYYLAQDALEYVRNKRDYNKLEHATEILNDTLFNNCKVTDTTGSSQIGIDNPGTILERGCNLSTFGPINNTSDDNGVYNGEKLYYHASGGEYNYDSNNGGVLTKFSRQVRVGYINANFTEIIVEVIVRWPNALNVIQEYKIRSHLTDW